MHKIVCMLIQAEDDNDAMNRATDAFDYLIDNGNGGHDYYTIFNSDNDDSEVSGTGRWGTHENPIKLDTDTAKKALNECLKAVIDDFTRDLGKIKNVINDKTDDEILDDERTMWEFGSMDLYSISNVNNMIYSAYDDGSIEAVYSKKQLDESLKDHNYVVLGDVHY